MRIVELRLTLCASALLVAAELSYSSSRVRMASCAFSELAFFTQTHNACRRTFPLFALYWVTQKEADPLAGC